MFGRLGEASEGLAGCRGAWLGKSKGAGPRVHRKPFAVPRQLCCARRGAVAAGLLSGILWLQACLRPVATPVAAEVVERGPCSCLCRSWALWGRCLTIASETGLSHVNINVTNRNVPFPSMTGGLKALNPISVERALAQGPLSWCKLGLLGYGCKLIFAGAKLVYA